MAILVKILYHMHYTHSPVLPSQPLVGEKPVTLAMISGEWRLLATKSIRTKKHPEIGLTSFRGPS